MKTTILKNFHKIHFLLIGLPIAFFYGALFFDLMELLFPCVMFRKTSLFLIVLGVVALALLALPRMIYCMHHLNALYTLRKNVTKPCMVVMTYLLFYLLVLFAKLIIQLPSVYILVLQIIGMILISIGGLHAGLIIKWNTLEGDVMRTYFRKGKDLVIRPTKKQ